MARRELARLDLVILGFYKGWKPDYGMAKVLQNLKNSSRNHLLVGQYSSVVWFDEYDFKLGAAISNPPVVAWKGGVWRRDFERGIVLVNPTTQPVTQGERGQNYFPLDGGRFSG